MPPPAAAPAHGGDALRQRLLHQARGQPGCHPQPHSRQAHAAGGLRCQVRSRGPRVASVSRRRWGPGRAACSGWPFPPPPAARRRPPPSTAPHPHPRPQAAPRRAGRRQPGRRPAGAAGQLPAVGRGAGHGRAAQQGARPPARCAGAHLQVWPPGRLPSPAASPGCSLRCGDEACSSAPLPGRCSSPGQQPAGAGRASPRWPCLSRPQGGENRGAGVGLRGALRPQRLAALPRERPVTAGAPPGGGGGGWGQAASRAGGTAGRPACGLWHAPGASTPAGSAAKPAAAAPPQDGRRSWPLPPRLAADPQGRCAVALLYGHHLALLPALDVDTFELELLDASEQLPPVATVGNSYLLDLLATQVGGWCLGGQTCCVVWVVWVCTEGPVPGVVLAPVAVVCQTTPPPPQPPQPQPPPQPPQPQPEPQHTTHNTTAATAASARRASATCATSSSCMDTPSRCCCCCTSPTPPGPASTSEPAARPGVPPARPWGLQPCPRPSGCQASPPPPHLPSRRPTLCPSSPRPPAGTAATPASCLRYPSASAAAATRSSGPPRPCPATAPAWCLCPGAARWCWGATWCSTTRRAGTARWR